MTEEKIQSYTSRITQGNRSEIIGVMYEIFFSYIDDAKEALTGEKDYTKATEALRRAGQVTEHLKNALDFKYAISAELYRIYDFVEREIAKAMYLGDPESLDEIVDVMRPVSEAFAEVAKQDTSSKVMKNTQEVVAGYTYGRNEVNEAMMGDGGSRGYLA